MSSDTILPFILRFEEEGTEEVESRSDDSHLYFDPSINGLNVKTPFIPWDYPITFVKKR